MVACLHDLPVTMNYDCRVSTFFLSFFLSFFLLSFFLKRPWSRSHLLLQPVLLLLHFLLFHLLPPPPLRLPPHLPLRLLSAFPIISRLESLGCRKCCPSWFYQA